jgi:hypothetical protein
LCSCSGRSLRLVLGKLPQFVLERLDLAFTTVSKNLHRRCLCSFVLLHTLSIMFRLHALQLQPTPVDDLVGEDGDKDGLEYWTTAVLVEIALAIC